ncbi:MAG: fused response regulator/phosphatase [bacterium]
MTDEIINNEEKYRILLVEDDENIAKLFNYNLHKAGYDCKSATDGKDGYEKAKEFKPHIIISDIMMPEVDGFQFRRLLLADEELKSIPFVFLTAKGEEDDILQGYDLEIEDYMIKTASPKIILAKISAILKSLKKEREKVVDEVNKAAGSMSATVVPENFPVFEGFDIRHWHVPFENIPGGDFIDYFKLDDTHQIIVLGDVMGKKWGAWYFAVAYAGYVRSAIRFALEATTDFSPAQIMQKVNESVFNDERISEVFITLSIIIIDSTLKAARYCGAGDLPIIFKSDTTTTIQSSGLLLGFNKAGDYKDLEISLKQNDELFLLSDGITDSRNSLGEPFGKERLIAEIDSVDTSKDTFETIKRKFINFTAGKFEDDISLIRIKML